MEDPALFSVTIWPDTMTHLFFKTGSQEQELGGIEKGLNMQDFFFKLLADHKCNFVQFGILTERFPSTGPQISSRLWIVCNQSATVFPLSSAGIG